MLGPWRRHAHPRDLEQVNNALAKIENGTWRRDLTHNQDVLDPRVHVVWLTAGAEPAP